MENATADQVKLLLDEAADFTQPYEVDRWSQKVTAFLRSAISDEAAEAFSKLSSTSVYADKWQDHARRVGHLQGIAAKLQTKIPTAPEEPTKRSVSDTHHETVSTSRKVFIVHGHAEADKDSLARFLTRLGLEPIVLHEQASVGRTVIEKFETYSDDIAFAVILLTPDDVGKVADSSDPPSPRARQNVILELGYFMGRLGRARVCALYKGGVELPSDYQGVIYIDMDSGGGWKVKLAQEFVQSKISINLEGLPGS